MKIDKNTFLSNTGIIRDRKTFEIRGTTAQEPTTRNKIKFVLFLVKEQLNLIAKFI